MEEHSIKRKKTSYYKILFSVPITLFVLIRALYARINSSSDSSIWVILVLSFFSILFIILLVNSIIQVSKKTPALIINDNELIDNTGPVALGLIKLDNISGCEIKKFQRTPHLVINLKDYSDIISSQSGFKKKMVEVKIKDLGTPLAINDNFIAISLAELKTIIEGKISKANCSYL